MDIKRIFAGAFALPLMLLAPASAAAYDEPHDICISVETKDIDINDIPGDRVVQLGVYTDNTPPYIILNFLLEKDSRLEYLDYRCISNAGEVSNMGGVSFEYGSGSHPDFISCCVPSKMDEYIDHNGLLVYVNVVLPDDVSVGDFFSVDLLWDMDDGSYYENQIMLENDWDAVFGNSSFSELNCGGIRITKEEEPAPSPPPQNNDKPSGGGNSGGSSGGSSGGGGNSSGGGSSSGGGNSNSGGGGDSPAKETKPKATKPAETATTAAATEPPVTEEETEAPATEPPTTQEETEAPTDAPTERVTTAAVEDSREDEKDGKNNFWIIIASTAAAAGLVSVAVWAARRTK